MATDSDKSIVVSHNSHIVVICTSTGHIHQLKHIDILPLGVVHQGYNLKYPFFNNIHRYGWLMGCSTTFGLVVIDILH